MLSRPIRSFIEGYTSALNRRAALKTEPLIHVDEIAAKVAKFYERLRNLIDYQEEHLLRKNTIERALQRRILFRPKEGMIAESLIKEIVRAGHLPNDAIPERKIGDVQKIIENLLRLLAYLQNKNGRDPAVKTEISQWLVRMTASAIEENLDPPIADDLLAELMFQSLRLNTLVQRHELSPEDRDLQLFIGIQRALLRADVDQINYRLLKFVYPNWSAIAESELSKVADTLFAIKQNIAAHLEHPLAPIFFNFCNRYNTIFYLLGDIVLANPQGNGATTEILESDEMLTARIGEAYQKRYRRAKRRLGRLAFFSIVSIFLSKIVIALAIEIPIDTYVSHSYSMPHMIANILVPPALMFFIISLIKLPSKNNWRIVMQEVRAVTFEEKQKKYQLLVPKEKGLVVRLTTILLYVAVSAIVLYWITKLLVALGFSPANIVVFILFISLVAATGIKVKNRSKEISLEQDKATFLSFIFDLLIIPFVTIGKTTLAGLAKFKFLIIIVNLIDLPFQVLIGFIENLRDFIKNRKEELY